MAEGRERLHVPEPMEAELLDVFETVSTLVSTLGYPVFEPLASRNPSSITFFVSQEMYDAIKALPSIEPAKAREDEGMDKESLKVVGKNYKVAYCEHNGVHQVREAYRFLAEGLASLEAVSLIGGHPVNEYLNDESGVSDSGASDSEE
ncbi:hypothetical protein Q31b_26350 [Novipirellula aureliae]|uniref:Uncharacterized protein n=1 Tax=Novipirellula aureliae TaxID=2527966 RepID=A0A5C6E1E6_9BACT|nr:hypothetical protein [Novipirellula aureliae]TWU41196.1 hypothetical protein Q31b_26350 [Novipirellula aureliae]